MTRTVIRLLLFILLLFSSLQLGFSAQPAVSSDDASPLDPSSESATADYEEPEYGPLQELAEDGAAGPVAGSGSGGAAFNSSVGSDASAAVIGPVQSLSLLLPAALDSWSVRTGAFLLVAAAALLLARRLVSYEHARELQRFAYVLVGKRKARENASTPKRPSVAIDELRVRRPAGTSRQPQQTRAAHTAPPAHRRPCCASSPLFRTEHGGA